MLKDVKLHLFTGKFTKKMAKELFDGKTPKNCKRIPLKQKLVPQFRPSAKFSNTGWHIEKWSEKRPYGHIMLIEDYKTGFFVYFKGKKVFPIE